MVAAYAERLGGLHLQHVMSWPEVILVRSGSGKLSDAVSRLRDMTLRRMDHVGVVVEDLEAATASFAEFGTDLEGEAQSRDAGLTVSSFTARAACVRHRRRKFVDNTGRGHHPDHADGDPRPAAVTFVTTEHFTLEGARSLTISELTGRASVFLGAVSGGLIALGLVATAAKTGVAFYMFGLILLPTLAFVGLATFHRVPVRALAGAAVRDLRVPARPQRPQFQPIVAGRYGSR